MTIDYRTILMKYAACVIESEGVDFAPDPQRDVGYFGFTREELEELHKAIDETCADGGVISKYKKK